MEPAKTVTGRLLEARNDGVSDYVADDGAVVRSQNVDGIIRGNHFLQGGNRLRGFRMTSGMRRVASIPVAATGIAHAMGIDLLNDKKPLKHFLNAPDNRAFGTTLERV